MKILAISGWKRSGKDTFADHLVEKDGYKKLSFANTLKDMAAEQYGIPRTHFDDSEFKEAPIKHLPVVTKDKFGALIHKFMKKELASGYWTPRAILILEGSVKRSVISSYWVKRVVNTIKQEAPLLRKPLFVIADLRYKSEAEQLREAFGTNLELIRINRFDSSPSTDPSEMDLVDYKGFDNVLNTQGLNLEEYKALIDMIYTGRF